MHKIPQIVTNPPTEIIGLITKPIYTLSPALYISILIRKFEFFFLMVSMVTWFLELVAKELPLRQSSAVVMSGL